MSNELDSCWVREKYDSFEICYKIKNVLLSRQSKFQKIEIVETSGFGRMLLLDGIVNIAETDEFIYHEMITHVALFVHPNPEKVLIIGGGDGGAAREVIRHPEVKKCYLVEIDEAVVEGCKKFIPQTAKSLDDPRVILKIEDGFEFVENTNKRFDIVIVDSTDPVGPSVPLFGKSFYENVYKILNDKGIVIVQAESPFYKKEHQKKILRILKGLFNKVYMYFYANFTYPGGLWSFCYASNDLCPLTDFNPQKVRSSGLKFSYYNESIHRAAFVLPEFLKEELKGYLITNQCTKITEI